MFIVLIFGLLYKKADATAACISMVLTGITAIFWAGCKLVIGTYPIAGWFTETYAAILVAFISMFLLSNYFHHRKKNIENI